AFSRHPTDSPDRHTRPMRTTPRARMSFISESPLELSLRDPERQQRLVILIVRVGHRHLLLQHLLEQRRFQLVLVGCYTELFDLGLLSQAGDVDERSCQLQLTESGT